MAQAGVNLVTAVGQQDKQGGSRTAPRQVMEKVQAGLVTPMQVLNDQQRRLFGCLAEAERGDQTAEGADQEARETTQRPGTPFACPPVLGKRWPGVTATDPAEERRDRNDPLGNTGPAEEGSLEQSRRSSPRPPGAICRSPLRRKAEQAAPCRSSLDQRASAVP